TPVHGVFGAQECIPGVRIPVRLWRQRVVRHTAVPPLTCHHDADTDSSKQGMERDGHTSLLCDTDSCYRVFQEYHPLAYRSIPQSTPLFALPQPGCTFGTLAYHGVPPRLQ